MKHRRLVIWLLLVVMVLFLGFKLRFDGYDEIPFPGQSLDEYSYSWVGMSLLRSGYPVGISGLPGYEQVRYEYINPDQIYQSGEARGLPLVLNYPWFDHPPLLGLITGGFALTRGADVFADVSVSTIRKPMVVMGTITLLLLLIVSFLEIGKLGSIVAGLIYAGSGLIVVSSRMVQGENGWLPFYLLSICGVILSKRSKWGWLLAWLSGFVAMGFKLTGIVSFIFIALWLISDEDLRPGTKFKICLGTVSFLFIFIFVFGWYGWLYDWDQFLKIQLSNAGRVYGIGFGSLFNMLTSTKVTNTVRMIDPWVTTGWLAWIGLWLATHVRKYRAIKLGGLAYLMVYIFVGSYAYGWYQIPFYPFLIMALAVWFVEAIREEERVIGVLLLLNVVIGVLIDKLVVEYWSSNLTSWWRLLNLIILFFGVFLESFRGRRFRAVSRGLVLGSLLLAVYLSVSYVHGLTVDMWYRIG